MIIHGIDITLPKGPAGILCSGGADSSLLLYILAKYSKHPLHVFTLANYEKKFANTVHSTQVVNYVINRTHRFNIKHYIYYAKTQTEKELSIYPLSFLKNTIESLYIGDTSYPPDDINKSFAILGVDKIQDSFDRSYGNIRKTQIGPFVYPFTNYTKKTIADFYKKEQIQDLFGLTRSCESKDSIDNHCGICWWCNERRWAFGKL